MNDIAEIKKNSRLTETLIACAAFFAIFIFLATSETASRMVLSSLILCGKSLIPAIFPFLVLCGILIRLGIPERIAETIGKPLGALLGIGAPCAASVISGLLCGFPTGAVSAYNIRKQGLCSNKDCERTVLVSSLASPAFVIAGIGISILGSARRGLLLWIFQVTATFCVGAISNIIKKAPSDNTPYYAPRKNISVFSCIAEAIREAANTMIGICGSVVFFSVFSGYVSTLGFLPNMLKCIFASFFELTSGISLTSQLLLPDQAFVIIAGAVGWSGLSVHAQTALVTNGEINLGSFISGKLFAALLTALFAAISVRIGIV